LSDLNPSEPPAGPDFVQGADPSITEAASALPEPTAALDPIPATYPAPDPLPTSYPAPGIDPASFGPAGAAPFAAVPGAAETLPVSDPATGIAVRERVGRGIVFSLLSIVVGVGLTMVLYQVGFIASITSFALAYAAIWLYTLGAGAPPRKGVWGVIAVIVVGVALSLISLVVSDMIAYLAEEYPAADLADKIDFIVYNLGRGEVWGDYTTDIVMYVLFAGLGTFGLVRQLGRARKAS
jgi:hypothetical protein